MAANSKIIRILLFVLAICGGIVGAFVAINVARRLQLGSGLQGVLVFLGAAGGFGVVWFFYWVSQNLFVEEDKKPR